MLEELQNGLDQSAVYIKKLLGEAKERGASDVHLTVGIPPKFRINGMIVTSEFPPVNAMDTEDVANSLMDDRQRRILDEKGEVDFSFGISKIGRFRVNVFKQRNTCAAAFRLVDTEIPTPQQLKLPQSIVDLYKKKSGLVLVTGPTGSGKSTTLASLIGMINSNLEDHIITLEDPIEYLHKHNKSIVNQREIGIDTMSYAAALRAALREDPDVILVGEMRDLETISTAITAAETGHLVFSTLHTIGAAETVDRIVDVFPTDQQEQIRVQLAQVLEGVISQRLVPTADGKGRRGAYEILLVNNAVRNLIREGKTYQINSVLQTGKKLGMMTMDDALFELYRNQEITAKSAIAFAQEPLTMERKIMM